MKELLEEERHMLIDNVLNDMLYAIQMNLGLRDGFNASIFFSGDKWDTMIEVLNEYIDYEINMGIDK